VTGGSGPVEAASIRQWFSLDEPAWMPISFFLADRIPFWSIDFQDHVLVVDIEYSHHDFVIGADPAFAASPPWTAWRRKS
jgi:hypothetical protein